MTKIILILAIATAFMIGTSMYFVLSDFEAEATEAKPPGAVCITEVIKTYWDIDYALKLCEQDELWEAIDDIMDALGKTTDDDNSASIIYNMEILASQNKILNEKITSLEATVANLEADTNDCWIFC